jgi:hypothetical protein
MNILTAMKERLTITSSVAGLCFAVLAAVAVAGCSRATNDPLATKVTLTKPYPLHYDGDQSDRISLQFAACELANQARLGYDFGGSLTNAGAACRKFITPEIKGIPLREALDQILKPEALTYELRAGKLVLKSTRATQDPLATKVTLTQPYPLHYEGDESNRITVQYAVMDLANQASLNYDWADSQTNAGAVCREYITPEIKGIPLREALDQILQPEALTYDLQAGLIVLKKN